MDFSHGLDPLERPRTIIWKSSYSNPNSRHSRLISTHPFNHSLQLMLPYTSSQQKTQLQALMQLHLEQSSHFHTIIRLNYRNIGAFLDLICDAISKQFHVRAMAIKGVPDPVKLAISDNHFIMHLSERMKYRFGMPCRKIEAFYDRDVWCVDVDLSKSVPQTTESNSDSASDTGPKQPGLIARLKWALERWLIESKLQIDFLVSIENQRGESMDLSLFSSHKFPQKRIDGMGETLNLTLPKNIMLPKIRRLANEHATSEQKARWEHTMKGIMNYVGLVATGAHKYLKTNNADDKYEEPFFVHNVYGAFDQDEYMTCKGGMYVNVSGLVPPSVVQRILDALREHYRKLTTQMTFDDELWYTVLVTGFAESPVSWRHCNHGTCIGAENDLLLVNLTGAEEMYLSMQCVGEYDAECQ